MRGRGGGCERYETGVQVASYGEPHLDGRLISNIQWYPKGDSICQASMYHGTVILIGAGTAAPFDSSSLAIDAASHILCLASDCT
jgi:hypothetical protein